MRVVVKEERTSPKRDLQHLGAWTGATQETSVSGEIIRREWGQRHRRGKVGEEEHKPPEGRCCIERDLGTRAC